MEVPLVLMPTSKLTVFMQIYLKNTIAETEADAAITMDIQHPKFIKFINENSTNAWGTSRGYEIMIKSPVSLVLPLTDPVFNFATWMQYQCLVTARKEDEQHSVSIFNGGGLYDVPVDIVEEYSDSESIRNTDLVAWVNIGNWHLCAPIRLC